jgi:hypothetical protein
MVPAITPILTANQQRAVWEGWLGGEIRAYYFADLSARYQYRQRIVTWLTLACSSGALATLIADWVPPRWAWLRPALALATTGLSLWSLVAHYQQTATECADLHFRWNTLAARYEALWDDMYDPDAARTLQQLTQIAAEISKSGTALPNEARRMEKWQDLVEAHHRAARAS